MKRLDERKTGILGFLAVLLFVITLCLSNAYAKDKKGADLVIEKKGGQRLQGELLAVKGSRLLILDSSSASSGELDINEIERIQVVKRPRIFSGLGLGSLLGGLAGLSIEGFSWDLGTFALAGASLGAIIGFVQGTDELLEMAGKSAKEMKIILEKLDGLSRYPEAVLAEQSATGSLKKFPRFHFSIEWGYFGELATDGMIDAFKKWNLGDTAIGIDPGWRYFEVSHDPCNTSDYYPKGAGGPDSSIKNLKIDFSLTRRWAVGFIYSPLFKYRIHGYRCLKTTINPQYGLKETQGLFLDSRSSGNAYFLSGSYMLIPDGSLRRSGYKVGAGIGWSRVRNRIEGSSSVDQEVASPCLMGFAELHHWLWGFMTLGVYADYKHVPVKFKPIKAFGWWNGQEMPVELSEQRLNFGGIGIGLQLGFHI